MFLIDQLLVQSINYHKIVVKTVIKPQGDIFNLLVCLICCSPMQFTIIESVENQQIFIQKKQEPLNFAKQLLNN